MRGLEDCFRLPARRTERGFCREMRGLEGLFLYVCASASAVWMDCFRLPARRTECGFCRMTRGLEGLFPYVCTSASADFAGRDWMELAFVSLRGALNADFAGRCVAWKDCFRLPALLRVRSCWDAAWKDCFCMSALQRARILRGASGWNLLLFACASASAVWMDCFRLSARRTERRFCREMRGLEGLFPSVCASASAILLGRDWEGLIPYACASASAAFAGARLGGACFRMRGALNAIFAG